MSEYKGTKRPPRSSKRIIAIYEGTTREFASISEAARVTGVSRWRIIRALKRSDGFIPGCPFSVDFPLYPPYPYSKECGSDSFSHNSNKNACNITTDKT